MSDASSRGRQTREPRGALVLLGALLLLTSPARAQGVVQWLCDKLRLDCSSGGPLSLVRSATLVGSITVTRMGPRCGPERALWECGQCWSPAWIDADTVAALKEDGIWIKPNGAEAKRVFQAQNLMAILGRPAGGGSRLVVLQRQEGDKRCPYRLRVASWPSPGTASDSEERCLTEDEYKLLKKTDQVRDAQRLSVTRRDAGSAGSKLRLLVGPAQDVREPNLLCPERQASLLRDRFDPIWAPDGGAVYLTRP